MSSPLHLRTMNRRVRFALIWLAISTSLATLLFFYKYLDRVTNGDHTTWLEPFITEFDGIFCGALLFLPLYAFMRRMPLTPRRVPIYIAVMIAFAFIDTSMMWSTRLLLFPLAGLGHYDYGAMPMRYFMELPVQIMFFCIAVGAVHGSWKLAEARERELSLTRAQLQNLRAQLQPHFLFNALNTISSTMYDDPAAADEMMERLSELLRMSLRTAQSDEVPLSTELETLDCYLAIMKARFGDKLNVRIDVDPSVRNVSVPSMVLQPLVENAIRHGQGTVAVSAVPRNGEVLIEVVNDVGPGRGTQIAGRGRSTTDDPRPATHDPQPTSRDPRPESPVPGNGLGLSATAERMRLLYGDGRFEAGSRGEEFAVRMRIPR
jgi:two-component system LytT family sensor kinase